MKYYCNKNNTLFSGYSSGKHGKFLRVKNLKGEWFRFFEDGHVEPNRHIDDIRTFNKRVEQGYFIECSPFKKKKRKVG